MNAKGDLKLMPKQTNSVLIDESKITSKQTGKAASSKLANIKENDEGYTTCSLDMTYKSFLEDLIIEMDEEKRSRESLKTSWMK